MHCSFQYLGKHKSYVLAYPEALYISSNACSIVKQGITAALPPINSTLVLKEQFINIMAPIKPVTLLCYKVF